MYLKWQKYYLNDLSVLRPFLKSRRSNILETKRSIWKHMVRFPLVLHWGANTYLKCKNLFFGSGWIDCRPRKASLSVFEVYPNIRWHHLKARPLELLRSLLEGTSTFGGWKLKCCWHPWIFVIFWTDPKKLYLPMLIPKCWRSTKDTSRMSCPSLTSTWRTTNLRTSRVAKDPRRCWLTFLPHINLHIVGLCLNYTFLPILVLAQTHDWCNQCINEYGCKCLCTKIWWSIWTWIWIWNFLINK